MPVTRTRDRNTERRQRSRDRAVARHNPIARFAGPPSIPPTLTAPRPMATASGGTTPDYTISIHRDVYQVIFNPTTVNIYSPTSGQPVRCSCEAFLATAQGCPHLYWLYSLLKERLQGQQIDSVNLSSDEVKRGLAEFFPLLKDSGDRWVPRRGQSSYDPTQPFGSEDLYSSTSLAVRRNVMCDILSTFEAEDLPEDVAERFSSQMIVSLEDCLRNDLCETLFRMACTDSAIFNGIRTTVPPEWRVNTYLSKRQRNIDALLQQVHALRGTEPSAFSNSAKTVPTCGNELRTIVRQIGAYCTQRGPQPFPQDGGQQLTGMLLETVRKVVFDFDRDFRTESSRPKRQDSRHNLYLYLIGNPLPVDESDYFVLDVLRSIPLALWSCWRAELSAIRSQINARSKSSDSGSLQYVVQLDQMIQDAR